MKKEILLENIPADLLNAYKYAIGYESQRNPHTRHWELKDLKKNRKYARYDYGKSSYTPISAEEAINIVKRNKPDIQNLRILFGTPEQYQLVEYEIRDNGSIYAIYGSGDRSVDIEDKHYKNIRYAPWKKVLENAYKIYVTDEYDHPLNPTGEDPMQSVEVGYMPKTTDPAYDKFAPLNSYRAYAKHIPISQDTGTHDKSEIQRLGGPEFRRLADKEQVKEDLWARVAAVRNALKKLERDKDDYTEEEYLAKKAKWEERFKDLSKSYDELVREIAKLKAKIPKTVSSDLLQFQIDLREKYRKLQDVIGRAKVLKDDYDKSQAVTVKKSDYDFSNWFKRLQDQLVDAKKLQDKIEATINDAVEESDVVALQSRLESIERLYDTYDQFVEEKIHQNTERIKSLEKQLADYDKEIDDIQKDLHPKATARKLANIERNKKELDPKLVNIIQFRDAPADSE